MKKIKLIIIFALFIPLPALSQPHCFSVKGSPMCFSNDDTYIAGMSTHPTDKKVTIVFTLRIKQPDRCVGQDLKIRRSEPLYINGVLTKMNKACSNDFVLIFPLTRPEADYVLKQFISKEEVVLTKNTGEHVATFNTTDFQEYLNDDK